MRTILDDKVKFWEKYSYHTAVEIQDIQLINDFISMKYFFNTHSSIHIKNADIYELFGKRFEVVSGGWYGDQGRWKAFKQIRREIIFKNVGETILSEQRDESYYNIIKSRFSDNCSIVIANNDKLTHNFNCKDVVFSDYYRVLLFDKFVNEFIDMTDSIDGMNFIGDDLF